MSQALFSAAELSAFTGGTWFDSVFPENTLAISTDTRCDNHGKIFFALSGEKFDAHNFLTQAVNSGCEALCIERNKCVGIPADIPVLLVDDTLKAMQNCAAGHRKKFTELTLFGVTGSVGKTSVKEMLYAICSQAAGAEQTLCTIGNTNNQIGVAQNLLRLNSGHRFAVIEAGTSSPGEIAPLSKMMMPDGAIVNSIAPCHLEKLIDLDGVATEKGDIFLAMNSLGTAVFPAECAGYNILQQAAKKHKICTFGLNGRGDVSARFISGDLAGSSFELTFPDGGKFLIFWQLTGPHNALNAAGAAALAYSAGIPASVIAQGLPQTMLPGMRMKKSIVNQVTYYNDAYNANPASMRASIDLLANAALPGRLILLLGGMRELGDSSSREHADLLALIRKKLPDAAVITIGNEFAGMSTDHFNTPDDAGIFLNSIVRPSDTVFAKGSRGNAVEKALPPEAR